MDDTTEGSTLGRMSVDKQYHGDLDGTARGEMLTGLAGTLNTIIIKDGKHLYEFDYSLPPK
jgi:hypothetical protein